MNNTEMFATNISCDLIEEIKTKIYSVDVINTSKRVMKDIEKPSHIMD